MLLLAEIMPEVTVLVLDSFSIEAYTIWYMACLHVRELFAVNNRPVCDGCRNSFDCMHGSDSSAVCVQTC